MKIGYARVSTKDQNIDLQIDALKKEGCEFIYEEVMSGTKAERPQLDTMLAHVRQEDVIVVWKLDRLGRSLKNLVALINQLMEKKVGLKSLHDPIDTTTAQGRLIFNIFASLAEFEQALIKERTTAGLAAARSRGRLGGKPKGLSPKAMSLACAAETLYKERRLTIHQIIEQLGISKATLYNYLRHRNVNIGT